MTDRRQRIVFFAEPATLAHVVRPLVLARSLDPGEYQVTFATGADFRSHVDAAGLEVHDLRCIGTRAYLAAVDAGRPVFPYDVLERYVEDDLRVIEHARPEIIVGDFRLSLAVSARLSGVPYLAISNAYWSPLAQGPFEVPVHAATRLFGVGFSNRVFELLRPLIFTQHSLPMHRLRRRHGMPSLGFDLTRVFTEGDVTLFADVPELVPTADAGQPGRYVYIGPVTWAPDGPLPSGLTGTNDERPLAFVSLGSSGDSRLLGEVVKGAVAAGCRVVASGSADLLREADLHAGDFSIPGMLPGDRMAAISRVVVCNGGSPAVHQALQQGTPVLGIPANLDQLRNMHFITRSGAGLALRADQVTVQRVRSKVERLLGEPSFALGAAKVRQWFSVYRADERFREALSIVRSPRIPVARP
ncbi:nucleotide disphospho-sugar-binding domain-containing protein [Accumulibacter sp.]|uniref:glycosyltransferase n=1 Tax=Accumulibacter sp. TaxID=2053492 RepID=UPI0025D4D68E|nr:nucleotide disphospho-sugar-binding domain-containing protein [Accumulibacter sp.]MCM8626758.1 glycosyl transferase family 1 [Accumulibacter sp.]